MCIRDRVAPGVDPLTGRAALAGGAPDADAPGAATGGWETRFVAVVMGAAILVVGIIPQPLFDLVQDGAQGIIPGPLITAATALGRALGLGRQGRHQTSAVGSDEGGWQHRGAPCWQPADRAGWAVVAQRGERACAGGHRRPGPECRG